MTNPIYATWMISNNIGDALTPWLIEKITGQLPVYVSYDILFAKYMVTGSILNHAKPYTTVWGAGIANINDNIEKYIDIRLVRGPVTVNRVRFQTGANILMCGDPTFLMPKFYNPQGIEKKYKVGICPHYVHQREVIAWIGNREQFKFLNVFSTPEKYVDDLLSCEIVFSSSLHGLIVADAYGVPSQWIKCTDAIGGDGTKFVDHLVLRECLCMEQAESAMGHLDYIATSPQDIEKMSQNILVPHLYNLPPDADKLKEQFNGKIKVPTERALKELRDRIWETCPFKPEKNESN